MNNLYLHKATISYGNASVTVFDETAQLVNGVVIAVTLLSAILIVSRLTNWLYNKLYVCPTHNP